MIYFFFNYIWKHISNIYDFYILQQDLIIDAHKILYPANICHIEEGLLHLISFPLLFSVIFFWEKFDFTTEIQQFNEFIKSIHIKQDWVHKARREIIFKKNFSNCLAIWHEWLRGYYRIFLERSENTARLWIGQIYFNKIIRYYTQASRQGSNRAWT